MGYFRHRPDGAHDLSALSTKELQRLVERYREKVKEDPKFKLHVQFLRKYEYELRRRPDYQG